MRVVILQPSYIPWRGYFHQIQKADVFVFYDCVQYDKHGWRNRNKIKTSNGPQWLTIPVNSKGCVSAGLAIKDASIVWNANWAEKHLKSISLILPRKAVRGFLKERPENGTDTKQVCAAV
jgi:hypothetical protein